MKEITTKNRLSIIVIIISTVVSVLNLHSQKIDNPAEYMSYIGEQYENIKKEMWDYTSTVAHSRSARKMDRKRTELINTIISARKLVRKMHSYKEDYSLRDSVVNFLTLYFNVLKQDYAKIIDLEEIAEQSYDLMEAYLLAQEKANEKLSIAAEKIDKEYRSFAAKHNVTLIEKEDRISKNLRISSEVIGYYNQVYLIFFKAYKQEMYLIDAIIKNDINSIEQNRNALSAISDEGLEKLAILKHYSGDYSINTSCKNALKFFKDEADNQIPKMADFIVVAEEYQKMVTLFESKDRMLLTNEEVDKYNKAVTNYKNGVDEFNTTNNNLNTKREKILNAWNNAVSSFMSRHIPKK